MKTDGWHFGAESDAPTILRNLAAMPLGDLLARACDLREAGFGRIISYSRKVFIPLTRLCRDVCGYCTFAATPRHLKSPFLSPDDVLEIARAGQRAGCHEALFTLGDKPELRHAEARRALERLGHSSTISYLTAMSGLVLRETGLLPHANAGVMTDEELAQLRKVTISQGLMLENVSTRLCRRGGPHHGSPDKVPSVRLEMIAEAGRQRVPFTSGILIGIGETRLERIESLLALRGLHERYGHLQEVIIQNFRAKPDTRMASAGEPAMDDLLWTAAAARLLLGPRTNIQVPPNLSYNRFACLLDAGINDWGGISPVTADHVNPEAPWPDPQNLEEATRCAGLELVPRLAAYPEYVCEDTKWIDPNVRPYVRRGADSTGFARDEWSPGLSTPAPKATAPSAGPASVDKQLLRIQTGTRLSEIDIAALFDARGLAAEVIFAAADELRQQTNGAVVSYVVNRNINYTNVCTFKCGFCAFSKGRGREQLRGRPYDLALDEIARRAAEAWDRGATEVCMQGGINPSYTGETYLALLRAVKAAVPALHVHAFSPLEVWHGAETLGVPVQKFLEMLLDAGLGSLPGTAAEILDDHIRSIICPDKLSTQQWLDVVATAHKVGLRTTATIMFGHIERPIHWARHLLHVRDLQERTGGFTEFVPLPFVHMEAPIYLRGAARRGPTWREVKLMHAIARLVLHPLIANIQASWVKLGADGVAQLLSSGVNDLGGTLMNESISRAAGTEHGQELRPEVMESVIEAAGRAPWQRTTLYAPVTDERRTTSFDARPLTESIMTPFAPKAHAVA
jgi:FO synthase